MYPAVLSFSSMMNSIMESIANNEMVDIVTSIFWDSVKFVMDLVLEPFYEMIYSLYIGMLNFIWVCEQAFDLFAGTQDLYVSDSAGNVVGQADFMTAVFTGSSIQNAYWYMMLAATVLCFFFTIIAVIRSMGDALDEMKRPMAAVLRQAFKAMITFFLIPASCLAVTKLGAAITKIITTVGSENGDQRISDIVFVLTVGDEWKSDAAKKMCASGRMFAQQSVREYINWRDINYIYAYIMCLFMIIVMITIVVQAVMRAMMLAVLFLTSPWFVSAIPLDDGAKFRSWTRLFAGFSFATFGPILVMRVYCVLLMSIGITGDISFGTDFNPVTGWILKMVITAFGLMGAWQSQYLILDIFSPETSLLLHRSQFIARFAGDAAKKAANAAVMYATGGAAAVGRAAGKQLADSTASGGDGDGGKEQ
ncbi:MAG: hypothetical protein J5966_04195 [Lachnospiraceae bacterium]|nr:hypothetical protein [Lachnospiraceae bacterium]